jgi:hypothetical protein
MLLRSAPATRGTECKKQPGRREFVTLLGGVRRRGHWQLARSSRQYPLIGFVRSTPILGKR